MHLNPIKANMTEIEVGDKKILFSYKTPVAYTIDTPEGRIYYRTAKRWSNTTTRHIKAWLPYDDAVVIEQEELDGLV